MRTEDVRARVRAQIAQIAAVPAAQVEARMSLTADLPLDSLQLYELAASLEDEFDLGELDEEAVVGIETVGDVEDRILQRLSAKTARGGE
jgi:acyl carrier protein